LYLSESAVKDLEDRDSATNLLRLRGAIEGALTRWVSGGRVYADIDGKPRFLKRLDSPPPEIWDVRVTEPRVQVRLFSRFAEPDTLVMTRFHTRGFLGRRRSRSGEWPNAMRACEKCWNDLFPGMAPFTGRTIHDYVTENCDDFPI
jgi:hypothetical protein